MVITAIPAAAAPIEEPKSISPAEALDIRINEGFTKQFCDHNGIRKAIGYQYDHFSKKWTIIGPDFKSKKVDLCDDAARMKLLEYMYYVDRHAGAELETVGALGMTVGGVIGILSANPLGIAAGITIISVAITLDAAAQSDKNLCYSYAQKISGKI